MTIDPATPSFWKDRFRASVLHLGLSAFVAGAAALLVFGLWFPYPYREISGGRELFVIVVTIDIVMGPFLTLAIFDLRKPKTELRRDMCIVVVMQLSALGYGMWTVAMARPVHMVFEIDRFRIIHANEVPRELLASTPRGINALPLTGPTLLGVRHFKNEQERMDATLAALEGVQIGARPDLWQTFDASRKDVLSTAKSVAELQQRFPAQVAAMDAGFAAKGLATDTVRYLPLVGRKSFWTVFIDARNGDVVNFMSLDPF